MASPVLVRTLFTRPSKPEREDFRLNRRQKTAAVVLGAGTGFVIGLTSAGSGTLIALVLIAVFRLTPQRVVGTDVFHAAVLLWAAGLAHWVGGNVDMGLAAAKRAVDISLIQYREGATDFTSVLNTQQAKLREEDLLASTGGSVVLSVIALNKALGGGWEIRNGQDFVPEQTREQMRARTDWGGLLPPEKRQRDIEAATEASGKSSRWLPSGWWPEQ